MIKIAVVGSRNFSNYSFFAEKLEAIISNLENVEFVSGGCPSGGDALIARYCKENNLLLTEYLPEWDLHGKKAGFLRNKLIVDNCTHLIAFWDEKSKGTKNSIDMAQKQNKPIRIVKI
jgi:predicted Rossmann fold nucleotide-binding protein DprA/Smf involved in DNA uptake